MRFKLLSWILSLFLVVASVSALSVTSPITRQNVSQFLNISFTNSSVTSAYLYNLSIYNSTGSYIANIFNYNLSNIVNPVSITSPSLCNAYASQTSAYIGQFGSNVTWYVCSDSSSYFGQGYIVVNYVDGSSVSSSVQQAVSTSCPSYVLSLDSSKVVSNIVAYTCAVATVNHDGVTSVSAFVPSLNNDSYSYNAYLQGFTPGSYFVNVSAYNSTGLVDSNVSGLFNIVANAQLNVSATNYTGGAISSFNLQVTDLNTSSISNFSTSSGLVQLDVVRGHSYLLNVSSPVWASTTQVYNVSNTAYQSTTLSNVLPFNSIFFYFYNLSNSVVLSNVSGSIVLNPLGGSSSFTGVNGTIIQGIPAGTYTASFYSQYNFQQLVVSIPEGSSQVIPVYLTSNASAVLLNTKDSGGSPISGVLCVARSIVNNSYVVVQSGISSVDGKIQFALLNQLYYDFNCSKSGYANNFFVENPILYSSYDVPMSVYASSAVVPSAYISISPTSFLTNFNNSFNIQFFSPYNSLTSYDYIVTYPSGSFNGSGTSSSGQLFTRYFNTSGSYGDQVSVFYEWNLSNGVYYNSTQSFYLVISPTTSTITSAQGYDYGFLTGDKIMLISFILLFLMGVAWFSIGFFGSLAIGGFVLFIFLNSQLLSVSESQIFLGSIVIMILLLVFRGKQ